MTKIIIDNVEFLNAFGRDKNMELMCPMTTFLDVKTGEVEWVYACDVHACEEGYDPDQNRARRNRFESGFCRFLRIPGFNERDYLKVVREFIDSNWTSNKKLHRRVRDAYCGSFIEWAVAVNDHKTWNKYDSFFAERVAQLADEFLRLHNVDYEWA